MSNQDETYGGAYSGAQIDQAIGAYLSGSAGGGGLTITTLPKNRSLALGLMGSRCIVAILNTRTKAATIHSFIQ